VSGPRQRYGDHTGPLRPTGKVCLRKGSILAEHEQWVRLAFDITPAGAFPNAPDRHRVGQALNLVPHLAEAVSEPFLVRVDDSPDPTERWQTFAETLMVAAPWVGLHDEACSALDRACPTWREDLAAEWEERPYRLVNSTAAARMRHGTSPLELHMAGIEALLAQLPAIGMDTAIDYLEQTLERNVAPGPTLLRRAQEVGMTRDTPFQWGDFTITLTEMAHSFAQAGSGVSAKAWWAWFARADLTCGARVAAGPSL